MSTVMIPALKSELMASTALTPTQHKGGLGAVVGIVASIAIPMAAPAIAASIGLSGAIGATMGSALVGAGLGAATAAITGGNVMMGALGGGIGGGIAGYNAVPAGLNGGTAAAAGGAPGQLTAPGALAAPSVTTAPLAPIAGSTVSPAGAVGFANSMGGSFIPQANGTMAIGRGVTYNSAGQALTGGAGSPVAVAQPTTYSQTAALSGGPAPQPYVGAGGTSLGSHLPTSQTVTSFNANPTQIAATTTPSAQDQGFFGGLKDKIFSSESAQQAGGKLLTMGVGNMMVGDEPNMTPEEQARMADLNAARAKQLELQNKKQAVSDAYVQQASNINPYYYGQQALTEEQNRLNRAQQAGLRNINPSNTGTRSATVRRNALDKSRLSGFDRGRQEADSKRLQLMAAAQSSAPTGSAYAGDIAGDLAAADTRYQRKQKEYDDYAGILEPLAADIFSVDSAAEREKKRQEAGATA